jgi:hypothetical protein
VQYTDDTGQADIIEQLYDRYPIRLPLIFIAIALTLIFVSVEMGPGPILMLAGCAGGLAFVAVLMLLYGFVLLAQRNRRLLPQVCPSCGAGEAEGTVYIAIKIPQIDRQIVACSRCETTWRTDLRR